METFVKLIVNEFNSFTIELIYGVSILLKHGSVNIGNVNKDLTVCGEKCENRRKDIRDRSRYR